MSPQNRITRKAIIESGLDDLTLLLLNRLKPKTKIKKEKRLKEIIGRENKS